MSRLRYYLAVLGMGCALAVASCSREGPTAPTSDQASSAHRLSALASDTVIYGPATFIRDNGTPRTDTTSFAAHEGDTLTIVVTSPSPQGLNATVEMNEVRRYTSADGHPWPDSARVVARATNALRVVMAGKPGSSLQIVVTARQHAVPVEARALTSSYGSSVLGNMPVGEVRCPFGSVVRYRFAPNTGFQRLRVVVDGRLAADAGSLTMDQAHWIVATADTSIALDASEQPLAQLLRNALTSTSPRQDWAAYQRAIDEAAVTWGAQAPVHLARIRRVTIDPVNDLELLVRLDSALAGMVTSTDRSPTSVMLRGASQLRTPQRRSGLPREFLASASVDREKTAVLLVNGILTESGEHTDNVTALDSLLQFDPGQRFPRSSVLLTGIYNSTYFSSDSSTRIQLACNQAAFAEIRARQLLTEDSMTEVANNLVGCLVASHARWLTHAVLSGDFAEMLRWSRAAIRTSPPPDWEVDSLAKAIQHFRDDALMHVLVVAHSEGSVLTQLAVQRLRINRQFNEDSASRCIGTVSVAGVGTTNWPLSDRHAKFVVAKWDIVTLLGGGFDNPRETIQDRDTRAVDFFLAEVPPDSSANRLSLMALAFFPKTIHSLQRYLSSTESGPRIANHIDDLYRTCAVGTVTVTPPAVTLQLDGARVFDATWNALDGLPLTTPDSVAWSIDSTLASVSPSGRVVAGNTPGTVALEAKVRRMIGTSAITIVDDSVRATYTPPDVSVSTRKEIGYIWPGPVGPGLPFGRSDVTWMTIAASAMPSASISSATLYQKNADGVEFGYEVPVNQEFMYFQCNVYIGLYLEPSTVDLPTPPYRLVVTDSHGLVTEISGTAP